MKKQDQDATVSTQESQLKKLTSLVDLKPAPYNPREIGKIAAAGLGKSLDAFGDISGIVWNARTGNLVSGHQRVAQLRKRSAKLVTDSGTPRVVCGDREFPVRIVDWDMEFEKAANLEANNDKIQGEFNDNLAVVLKDVQGAMSELQFEELGFDELAKANRSTSELTKKLGSDVDYVPEYIVMVTCTDEQEQTALLQRLDGEGYKVRALMS